MMDFEPETESVTCNDCHWEGTNKETILKIDDDSGKLADHCPKCKSTEITVF